MEEQKLDELETEITNLEIVDPDLNATGQIDLTKSSPQAIINDGLKENLHNRIRDGITTFSSKLNSLGSKLREINTDNSDIRTRLSGLKERHNTLNDKLEYYKQQQQQQQLQPSPPTEQATTTRPFNRFRPSFTALNQWNRRGQNDEAAAAEQQEPEAASSSEKIEKKPTGRRYSIFVPEPKGVTPAKSITQAALATSETTADAIEPAENVLDVVVYGDEEQSGSTGAAAAPVVGAFMGGGARIQHGGNARVVKIIRVKTVTPKIQALFLGFQPANTQLTDEFLTEMEQSQGRAIIDNSEKIQEEYKKYGRELIQNTDNRPFFESLGPKAVHKSTISNLIKKILDGNSSDLKYFNMYDTLWRFMAYSEGCLTVLTSIFGKKSPKIQLGQTTARITDLTWKNTEKNELFDRLFSDLSKCYRYDEKKVRILTNRQSNFLINMTSKKKEQKYRFMLNWVILIAFHLYYSNDVEYTADKTKVLSGVNKQSQIQTDCRELLSHLYDTYIGWMDKMSSESLNGIFYPRSQASATYKTTTDNHFSTIVGDTTLTPLVNGIQDFLCKINQSTQPSQSSPLKMRQVVTSSISSGHPISPASAKGASAETGRMNPRPVSPNISPLVDMFDNFAQRPASPHRPALRPTTSSTSPSSSSASASEIRPLSASSVSRPLQMPAHVRHNIVSNPLQSVFTHSKNPAIGIYGETENMLEDVDDNQAAPKQQQNDTPESRMSEEEQRRLVEELRKRLKEEEQAKKKAAEEAIAKQKAAEEANRNAQSRDTLEKKLESVGNRNGIPFTSLSFRDSGSPKKFNGGKPRTRKHNSAKPQTTTKRKRSTHPANQRKYTRRARRDRVSGSAKRTKRVKNNLG
jgi:hypothetical protein